MCPARHCVITVTLHNYWIKTKNPGPELTETEYQSNTGIFLQKVRHHSWTGKLRHGEIKELLAQLTCLRLLVLVQTATANDLSRRVTKCPLKDYLYPLLAECKELFSRRVEEERL